MNSYIEIKEIIDEYIELMDKLIVFEQDKLEAIKEKNNDALNTFLKEEQVYLLQLRGLDKKRETIQKHLGIDGLTYKEIIEKTQGTIRKEFETSYDILSIKISQFEDLQNTIKTYIDIKLHTIDSLMNKFGASSSSSSNTLNTYDKINIQNQTAQHKKFEPTKV